MIKASVVIPTYNRSRSLARALESLNKLDFSRLEWEVVVVDNNSNDNTEQVTKDACNRLTLKIRYVKEKRLSFTVARNTGAEAAEGEILLYIDDDVTVEKGWMRAIVQIFDIDSKIGMAGGPIKPIFELEPPEWVLRMDGIWLSLFDCGKEIKEVPVVPGPNLCIRRSVLKEVGGFPPDTIGVEAEDRPGTFEKVYIGPGDWGLSQKVRSAGYKIFYAPEAVVYHHIPSVRLTKKWWHARFSGEACYLSITRQYKQREISVKLLLKSLQSLFLAARTVICRIKDILIGIPTEHHDFRISFYLSEAKTQFVLALYPELAEQLWNIGLTGIMPGEYTKLVRLLQVN